MQRRDLLRTGGLFVCGGMTALSGCSGVVSKLTGSLEVTTTDSRVTGFGNVVVTASVRNDSDETKSGTLWAQVKVDGGSTYEESENVIVPAHTEKEYQIRLDIDFGESLSADRYSYKAWLESD
ncbi:hypothetical protein ZOD2009_21382 [Haladaptatus paucihalophilus DX253]|uniref:Uncharacterized protein n=1 Tax=Haladaptatus paucihalophilus DX253 TaxID=797209 RepID=E7QZ27_HALPU|nr:MULTISPECIES: hypothetical protein [Haladaptatus]EFW90188.1 hypothetical protein ZOD2009_21382 [Haladaptatus paucihalophilus DX253]ODR81646.1 hypothetical protein BG842_08655 [Haladaptatus sp. W1]GKZ14615.1 hypothetical protein HAL_24960 [Haladaptatus sp. T7]SHL08008.1 hypothetical protein SAMN05444342_2950 [Haladaptatus paucihalophilus DX253]